GGRLARNLSAGSVAGIAAWSSYSHMVGVALHYGERPEVAYVLPASVDGMLIVASVVMADDKRTGRKVRWSARIAFLAGVLASVAANVAHAAPTLGARIVAAWPAVALLLVVEMLSRAGKHAAQTAEVIETVTVPTVVTTVEPSPVPAEATSAPAVTAPARRQPARAVKRPTAAERVAKAAARNPQATPAEIAARLKVSERTVQRHMPRRDDTVSSPAPTSG
ncbi:DUF2637 domain-containing protein, partial [Luedemannella flava]